MPDRNSNAIIRFPTDMGETPVPKLNSRLILKLHFSCWPFMNHVFEIYVIILIYITFCISEYIQRIQRYIVS